MKFLLAVCDTHVQSATPDEMAAITALNADMRAHDQLIMAVGLAHPSSGISIDGRASSESASIVPNDEFMSGFWVIDVDSSDEAIALAHDAARACRRRLELREILE